MTLWHACLLQNLIWENDFALTFVQWADKNISVNTSKKSQCWKLHHPSQQKKQFTATKLLLQTLGIITHQGAERKRAQDWGQISICLTLSVIFTDVTDVFWGVIWRDGHFTLIVWCDTGAFVLLVALTIWQKGKGNKYLFCNSRQVWRTTSSSQWGTEYIADNVV